MNESMPQDGNHDVFRECLSAVVLARTAPRSDTNNEKKRSTKARSKRKASSIRVKQSDSQHSTYVHSTEVQGDVDELADFVEYLAGEIYHSLPAPLQNLSYQAVREDPSLAETYSNPLSLSVIEDIASLLPSSVEDTLETYSLIEPPSSDMESFLSPVLASYVAAVTTAPPKWIETRTDACEICERDWIPLTYHHLIPKQVHAKVLKRGLHDEPMLDSVAWLCRACHSFVHGMASNEELARDWFTVERIWEREDVQKWAQWIGSVRWKKR